MRRHLPYLTAGLAGMALLVAGLALYQVSGEPIGAPPLTDNRDVFPQSITALKPADVCKDGERVVVSENPRGRYYVAERGPYTVTWTEGDDKFGFFYEDDSDYPETDSRTLDCLVERAVPGLPE